MRDERPPIPAPIWQRLHEFLADEATGSITLHCNQGHVLAADFLERVRVPMKERPR